MAAISSGLRPRSVANEAASPSRSTRPPTRARGRPAASGHRRTSAPAAVSVRVKPPVVYSKSTVMRRSAVMSRVGVKVTSPVA